MFDLTMLGVPNPREQVIKGFVRRKNLTIYGAQALNAQLQPRVFSFPVFGRDTYDYDIYSKKPKQNAVELEHNLNKNYGNKPYTYVKSAKHKGTFKVRDIGTDNIRGTEDDYTVADLTIPKRKIRTVMINGVKYAHISERERDARRSITEPQYAFRKEKDLADLHRINLSKQSVSFWRR